MSLNVSNLIPEQSATLLLWQRVNTSLSAFYKLLKHYQSAGIALQKSASDWAMLSIHAKHIGRHTEANDVTDKAFIQAIEQQIRAGHYNLLFLDDEAYPNQLKQLFDPPPVLFYRGNVCRLAQAQIAMVGSRKPSTAAQKITFDMAQYLAQAGYVITSGLAQGVDAQSHLGALSQQPDQVGRTVGVMGTGIDVCYPKQHQVLFDRIINEGGCIISELLPGTPPNKHTFPRRNRIVAGLSLGTIVTEAAVKSGSLITARLTSEQGKQVFAIPSSIDNVNAQGCLYLIREGATLIYHPDHVISDLATQFSTPIGQSLNSIQSQDSNSIQSQKQEAPIAKPSLFVNHKLLGSNEKDGVKLAKTVQFEPSPTNISNGHKPNRQSTPSVNPVIDIPEHLQSVCVHVDWDGQDLDALVKKTGLDTPSLLSQLMELELLGVIIQVSGRYKRA